MSKQIIITGATGIIGTNIARALIERGDDVFIFSRSPANAQNEIPGARQYIRWTPEDIKSWSKYVNGKDAVIHLAGTPVMAKRWTAHVKADILGSRQIGTRAIVKAIKESSEKPKVFISASAIGYYGTVESGIFDEKSPAGSDFLATVCKIWEKEASEVEKFGLRRISMRTGIVLDSSGGALKKMITPYRLFAGGPLGKGTQGFPWIHIDDLTQIFLLSLDDKTLDGPINAVAPQAITMNEFAETLGKVLKRPVWLKVPRFILRLAVGEGAETIVKTPVIIPSVLQKYHFNFKYDRAESALKEILQ